MQTTRDLSEDELQRLYEEAVIKCAREQLAHNAVCLQEQMARTKVELARNVSTQYGAEILRRMGYDVQFEPANSSEQAVNIASEILRG